MPYFKPARVNPWPINACRFLVGAAVATVFGLASGALPAASETVSNDRVDSLLMRMTLEEKLGQLSQLIRYNRADSREYLKGEDGYVPPETGSVIGCTLFLQHGHHAHARQARCRAPAHCRAASG